MATQNRRRFLQDVSSGMVIAGIGAGLASDLGISSAFAFGSDDELVFGEYERLIHMMQEMPADKMQVTLVEMLRAGETSPREIISAAALANAETFGGEDYVGFHTEMALIPALRMSEQLAERQQWLPILKVVYRNQLQMQEVGSPRHKTLRPLQPPEGGPPAEPGRALREATRAADMERSEQLFASIAQMPLDQSFNALLDIVEDDINVHRFVLAHRSRELVGLIGEEMAHTILRQCVRFCVDSERGHQQRGRTDLPIRRLVPRLLDQYSLAGMRPGSRDPGDEWVGQFCDLVHGQSPEEATEAVAAALKEGISPEVIGESLSLAANMQILRQGSDVWRTHGDSVGVHASDAMNSWRNMIRVSDAHHCITGLLVGAFHTTAHPGFQNSPYPTDEHLQRLQGASGGELLGLAEEAICSNDQALAAAAISAYGDQGCPAEDAFALMRKYAISEDGRLHAEKYYWTAVEEFATIRPAFRWRQLVSLARVTASGYGYDRFDNRGHRAPGYESACELLDLA